MSEQQPPLRIDVPFLLHAAGLLPGDPQVDDYGPLFGAVARVYARAMDRDVYGSQHLKAGALLHSLIRMPCLEHSNEAFAWHATEAFLSLNGHRLDYRPKEAVALVREAASGTLGAAQIARRLRDWTIA
ncbi:fic family toxin-antitoxin system, toxin component [Streptomyces rectiverticillatus]|uniref:fic family toxin-antitoxin system, toxin component n=1 Tax=Streptomyces rectiverticillatus TaxID=173860 RepID=UPI0015C35936|nr:fic family toxin-antitoxin system, toxin component [Streptomyces rectiverticillatus]QLE75700.1 fic family toxin-antitoxin system, toxin component [Streptomyces rectiverticillatus]